MKTNEEKILDLIKRKGKIKPKEIEEKIGISRAMIFRYLKKLVDEKKIEKIGKTPHIFYKIKGDKNESRILESKEFFEENFLKKFKKNKTDFWKLKKKGKIDFDFLLKTSALFSSKIEGNTLDLNSFLNQGNLAKNKKKDFQEIQDLIEGYKIAQKLKLNEKNFLKVHKIISKNILSKNRQGCYRKEPVGVFSSQGLEYMAIEVGSLEGEMKEFFTEIKKLLNKKMTKKEVYFWSLWLHLILVLIHPFSDGNGRMARILEKWFLAEKLGKEYWFLEIEKFYWENLDWYYRSLNLGVNYWEVDFKKAWKFLDR